jgi:diadenosine tetraphosphate (Ap4A) HIT family hydrolase
VKAFSEASAAAFADLGNVVRGVETMLRATVNYERINYLMLMMVDPDVHFHVIPRYATPRDFAGTSFPDGGWPGPPQLEPAVVLDVAQRDKLRPRKATPTGCRIVSTATRCARCSVHCW